MDSQHEDSTEDKRYTLSAMVAKLELQNDAMLKQLDYIHATFQMRKNRTDLACDTPSTGVRLLVFMDRQYQQYLEIRALGND